MSGGAQECAANKFPGDAEAPGHYTYSVSLAPTICLFVLFYSILILLEFDEIKQNHIHETLGEQNFILKIYLSNNAISKAGHCNKKEKGICLKVFF